MNSFFKRIKVGVLCDHYDLLGGGTVHAFKFIEYLKRYYDVEVNVPGNPKPKEWMRQFLNLDTEGVTFYPYVKGCGDKYDYLFLNISHWRSEPTKAFKKWILVFFPQFFFPLYDYKFLANSEYTKGNIEKRWKVLSKKIEVVYPPVMTSQFNPLPKVNKTIIHVSRISPPVPEADKGHKQMINAFKEMVDAGLKDWTFHIVGQIQDQVYFEELYRMASGYPIVFHPSISFKELQGLYGQATIYWHMTGISKPNDVGAQEHFGLTILEAMSSGCIPISLNTGGPKEIIEDAKSGFLVNNVQELKQSTMAIIESKVMQKAMSENAIERSKLFDEKVTKKKFYSIITRTDKVSIIIVCWNNSQLTKNCVDRLYEVTPEGFELILVDNGSTDDTWKVLENLKREYPNIKTIHNDKNLGFAKGNNIALKVATRDHILYLNNDTLPQWGWLERMVDVLESNTKVGIVGARLYFDRDTQGVWKIQHAGITFKNGQVQHIGHYQTDIQVSKRGVEEVEAVTGACLMVRKILAGFDENYIKGYFEDIDLCLRVRELGFKVVINHEARLIHLEGKSQDILKKEDKRKFDEITERNRKKFEKRWPISKINNLPKIDMTPNLTGIKHEEKVEIGGGERPVYPSYAQVDLKRLPHIKYNNDARILPFPSSTLTDICANYMINSFSKIEAEVALKEWFRCLKPGGRLELYVPDLIKLSKEFISTKNEGLLNEIYGNPDTELDSFKWGYCFESLDTLLSRVNFVRVTLIKPIRTHSNSLGIEAYKPL